MRWRDRTSVIVGLLCIVLLVPTPAGSESSHQGVSSHSDAEGLTRPSIVKIETADDSRFGTEPSSPYPIPRQDDIRPCAVFENEIGPAIHFIYGYPSDRPNRYGNVYVEINRIISSVDFALDESAGDLEQDMRSYCRFRPAEGATPDVWAQARLTAVDIGTERVNGRLTFDGIVSALRRQGFGRSDRIYVVFVDDDASSQACSYGRDRVHCLGRTEGPMYATAELWDTGVVTHELTHALGAAHTSGPGLQCPTSTRDDTDVMLGWWDHWQLDPGHDDYYDPSDLYKGFSCGAHNDTSLEGWNVARSPFLFPPEPD